MPHLSENAETESFISAFAGVLRLQSFLNKEFK
jgi:hypothetical protein